ncbi:MAG: hypothetical protein JWM27_4875 [Gemmatimonadetes bacterium]|nr:hypothetical protein [Gemmatimonadota bacterium]
MGEERIIPLPPRDAHREADILNELPNATGLVLWQDLRHVRDWLESPPEIRVDLFKELSPAVLARRRAVGNEHGELIDALGTFASMKSGPLSARPGEVARACEQVVEWASRHEYPRTGIEWAEAAARCDPENPRLANLAGRLIRNSNDYDRAEVWFKRGIGVAREQNNIVEQVWGHLGFGKLCQELGRIAGARRHLNRGSRLAWQGGPPSLAASAQHDLCFMLIVRGHLAEAAQRGRRALYWYPKTHARIPFFAADIGLMLVLDGRFSAAVHLLRPVLRAVEQPSARATILALAARAYAGAGVPEESAVLRRRALKILDKHRAMEPVTRWHLADAQRLAGNWLAAQAEAETTLAVAIAQNDREIERLTRKLLRQIATRRRGGPRHIPIDELRDFVRDLVDRVAQWAPRRERQWSGPWGNNRAA